MSRDGQVAPIRTRMASYSQRADTKHIGRLLAARGLYEKKIERFTVFLKLINFIVVLLKLLSRQ